MLYKATYASEAEVPDELKAFYHKKGGKWVFNFAEFEGIDDVVAPGLAANRDEFRSDKEKAEAKLQAAVDGEKAAKDELARIKAPGTKVISKDEAKQLEDYQALGPVKDLANMQSENTELRTEKEKNDRDKGLKTVCEETGLSHEAVVDLLDTRLKGGEIFSKAGKGVDPKTKKEIDTKEPWVRVTTSVDGKKDKVEEFKLSDYAKDKAYPTYLVNGLFAQTDNQQQTPQKTLNIPDASTGRSNGGGKQESGEDSLVKKVVARGQQETSTRRKPWDTAEPAAK